jgi:hypothetical protein
MPVYSTFNQSLKVATEVDRGTAPSGNRSGKAWWEGGRWFDIITDGLPSLQDNQAIIVPQGHAGDRRMNQQAAVVGRKWSEGDLSAPFVADFAGVLLYAAMGSASTTMTPSSSANGRLLGAEPMTDGKSLVLEKQPSDGGAILRFVIDGIQGPGTISVCGIDAFGNGASELISFASAGAVWSRTSFSSVGASSLAVSGCSAGTISVSGIRNYTHTFTHASTAPTLSFERQGVPTTGEASANLNHLHPAMVLRSLTLETNAEQVDGIFMLSADFEGDPSGASTKTTLNGPSSLKIWPSWTLRVRRDNGTQWDVVQNISLNITPANANYRAAAGVQGPQGSFFGGVEYTGSIEILLTNEAEYIKWRSASEIQMHALWDTPWKMAGSTNYQLSASIPAYLENIQTQDSDGKYILSGDLRAVRNDNFPFQFQLRNGTPGAAYSGTASANL